MGEARPVRAPRHLPPATMLKRLAPPLLILLLAFALRVHNLEHIPPGLTHDEANHGREAISILGGELALFFPLNYGSEPLYSYTVAGSMSLLGRNLLALRLVNVYFGLLAIAATYLWGRLAFGRPVALLAAALLTLSFWPLALSREALRAGMMPFFMTLAAIFIWHMAGGRWHVGAVREPPLQADNPLTVIPFALTVAATLYNYLAARVAWLLFPLFLAYLWLFHRPLWRRTWRPVLAGLLLAGLLTVPMFLYLRAHPEAQTRLSMFRNPAGELLSGDFSSLLANAAGGLLAFVLPGAGDHFLAYNIPGRPIFEPLSALFFLAGIAVCLWRWRRPAYTFLLLWFLTGIIPSLLTGATANTTRNVAALAPTFLLPAVGFVTLAHFAAARLRGNARPVLAAATTLWLLFVTITTTNDYFRRWGQSPDVRAAYQHTLVEALAHLEDDPGANPLVISSVYPGVAHNPSIALVLAGEGDRRWVDGRYALLLPERPAHLLTLASAPLHPAFSGWVAELEQVSLRPDDLDPYFTLYELSPPAGWPPTSEIARFGRDTPALRLVQARWLTDEARPGTEVELLQVWQVLDPAGIGPRVPPLNTTDVVLFTHVLRPDGTILTQQDRLDAPSWDWQPGDYVVQIHPMVVPVEATPGRYEVVVGVYDRASEARLPLYGRPGETRAFVLPLDIIE